MLSITLLAMFAVYVMFNVALVSLGSVRALQWLGFYAFWNETLGAFGWFISIPLSIFIVAVVVWVSLFFIIYSGLLWIIVLFVCIESHRRYRASGQYALLWLLTVSAERGIPLSEALEAFASERRGHFARGARKLAAMLESGVDLPDALEQTRGMLPSQALPLIRVGCESGDLAESLRRASTSGNALEPMWMSIIGKVGYLMMLTVVGLSLFSFIMMKIIPSYEKIFWDFDMDLPTATKTLMSWSGYFYDYGILFTPAYFAVFAFLLLLAAKYFGWNPPGLNFVTRRLDAADLLDGLSLAVKQQMSMLDGLRTMAKSYPRRNMKSILWKTANDVADGRDWAESLYDRGILRQADLTVLQSAQRTQNLAWALREVAESNRRRFMYKFQAFAQTTFPLAIILMGLIVGYVVMGLFFPLLKLITMCS